MFKFKRRKNNSNDYIFYADIVARFDKNNNLIQLLIPKLSHKRIDFEKLNRRWQIIDFDKNISALRGFKDLLVDMVDELDKYEKGCKEVS